MTARPRTPAHILGAAAAAAVLTLALSACSSAGTGAAGSRGEPGVTATPSAQVTSTPAANAKIIKVKFTGSKVSPDGVPVQVTQGQPIVLQISSPKSGQLHVHSSPQEHINFPSGDSEITLDFKQPGVIDIEDHALNQLIVQLEVR
ncbi:MAG TPA: hypothetical protein VHZ06_00900 [Marmoricola sp.]|nr:hypothetical protein [Marmoricola sp.]